VEEETRLGKRFEIALDMAIEIHGSQARKGTDIPYLGHLLGVASIVVDDGGSEDEVVAALLHDSVEDSDDGEAVLARIRDTFGDRVSGMVEALSDAVGATGEKAPWRPRKEAYLAELREQNDEAVLRISIADKLHNARSIRLDLDRVDDPNEVWGRFKVGEEDQLWLYRELADVYLDSFPGPLAIELDRVVAGLEAGSGAR